MNASASGPNSCQFRKRSKSWLMRQPSRPVSTRIRSWRGLVKHAEDSFVHIFKTVSIVFRGRRNSIACFFVHKKQGRQRLMVDVGEVRRHFKRPPAVALASPKAFAGVECDTNSRFCISTVAFRLVGLPDDFSYCFALLGGTAREFGVHELDGEPLGDEDYVWPCCHCFPMGFSWAACLAQQATTVAVVESTGIAQSELLHGLSTEPRAVPKKTTSGSSVRIAWRWIGLWVVLPRIFARVAFSHMNYVWQRGVVTFWGSS